MEYTGPERRSDCIRHEETINKLVHVVFGNGEPGLPEKVRAMEKSMLAIETDLNESKKARQQIAIGVIVGVVLAAFNLAVTFVHKL